MIRCLEQNYVGQIHHSTIIPMDWPTSYMTRNLPRWIIVIGHSNCHNMVEDMHRMIQVKHLMEAKLESPTIVTKLVIGLHDKLVFVMIGPHALVHWCTFILVKFTVRG